LVIPAETLLPVAVVAATALTWVVSRMAGKPADAPEAAPAASGAKDDQAAAFQAAATGIRDSAKWTLGAFGAVGALLIAGVQFGGVGKLEAPDRWWALGGALFGLVGVMWAIVGVGSLLRPRAWTMSGLAAAQASDPARKELATKPELLSGYHDVQTLWTDYSAALDAYGCALRDWSTAVGDERKAKEDLAETAARDVGPFAGISRRVLLWANHFSLLAAFDDVQRRHIIPGAALALIGLVIFTLETTSPALPVGPDLSNVTLLPTTVLEGSALRGADLSGATLVEVSLKNADLSEADLSKANLSRSDLSGANLVGADLSGATLDGVLWSATTCPDGTVSDASAGTCIAHLNAPPDQ
jgi:hypothetical protein